MRSVFQDSILRKLFAPLFCKQAQDLRSQVQVSQQPVAPSSQRCVLPLFKLLSISLAALQSYFLVLQCYGIQYSHWVGSWQLQDFSCGSVFCLCWNRFEAIDLPTVQLLSFLNCCLLIKFANPRSENLSLGVQMSIFSA